MAKHQLIVMLDGVPVPSELALTLNGFSKIWNQDNKEKALREIGWIYWMYHVESPYREAYPLPQRKPVVTKEVYGNEDTKLPAAVTNAAQQYLDFYYKHNLSLQVLEAAEGSVREIIKYFDNVDMDDENKRGDLKYNPKDVISNMQGIATAQDSLNKLKDRAMKELQSDDSKVRGAAEKTKYNT